MIISSIIYLQLIKNHIHPPCFSNFRFSLISLEPHELQKTYLHSFVLFSKELSALTRFYNLVTKSADLHNVNFPIKNQLSGKICHFENFNNFFPYNVKESNLHTNKISTQKILRNHFKFDQMRLLYFCELDFDQLSLQY